VQALLGVRFPDVINDDRSFLADSFVLPTEGLRIVAAPLRFPGRQNNRKLSPSFSHSAFGGSRP
jgi:hypothetical protein